MDWHQLQQTPAALWLDANQDLLGPAIIAVAFIESFAILGIMVPGVALLAAAAFIAGTGVLDLFTALACAFTGAVLGDCSSFFIGRYFHRYIPRLWPFRQHQSWIDRGERFFARHGVASIVIGRFVGPIRPVMPLVAGTMTMPATTFVVVDIASALLWAPLYILPGYLAGSALEYPTLSKAIIIGSAAVLALVGAVVWWLGRNLRVETE